MIAVSVRMGGRYHKENNGVQIQTTSLKSLVSRQQNEVFPNVNQQNNTDNANSSC